MRAGRKPSVYRLLALALVAALSAIPCASAQERDLEDAVKATFLMRFASFVQWPAESFPDPAQPVAVCLVGDAAFARLVESAARGERVGRREIAVRHFETLPPDAGCHLLFVAGAPSGSGAAALQAVHGQPVLTVTDARRGRLRGMIHFVLDDGRVRFHIDRDAAEAASLNVSSRLLSVAASVRSRRPS